jgi:hypothetical protein
VAEDIAEAGPLAIDAPAHASSPSGDAESDLSILSR